MPRLSVIVPAYNAADTIGNALRSTLRDLPRDSEIIVLDDGSTDGTADIAHRTGDARVRVMSHANAGVARTLNDLLAAADSEFVARMDADDIVIPGRFRRQMRAVHEGADAVFTTVVTWGNGRPGVPRPSSISSAAFPFHLLLTNPVAHSTFLGRRASIAAVGGYREIPTEDYDLWLRLSVSGARLNRLGLPGLAYRVHPGQVTASASWRRSSWESPELGAAYSELAEQRISMPATRFTSLSIDPSFTADQKREMAAAFTQSFIQAVRHLPAADRAALTRKLSERLAWLDRSIGDEQAAA